MKHVWWSEGNFEESVLFSPVGSKNQTQAVNLGSKCLYYWVKLAFQGYCTNGWMIVFQYLQRYTRGLFGGKERKAIGKMKALTCDSEGSGTPNSFY